MTIPGSKPDTPPGRSVPTARYLPAGDTAVVVEFGDTIDARLNATVLALSTALLALRPAGLVETVPTFRSLMIHYDPLITSQRDLIGTVEELLERLTPEIKGGVLWRLPACYEPDLAPDLDHVAATTGLPADQVVALHSSTLFQVYMLGFLPGFIFLGGLPAILELPRRKEPRVRVPAGSVAIALTLSAIYPVVSPGGWHLIGRCPVKLFDTRRDPPALIAAGDQVQFDPVSRSAFERLVLAVDQPGFDPIAEFRAP